MEVPDIKTADEWEKFKKKLIRNFKDNFEVRFKEFGFLSNPEGKEYPQYTGSFRNPPSEVRVKGYDFDEFGKGTYTENEMNKRLNRAGLPYDKGEELRETMKRMLKENKINMEPSEDYVLGTIVNRIRREDPALVPERIAEPTGVPPLRTRADVLETIMMVAQTARTGGRPRPTTMRMLGYTEEEIAELREKYARP